MILIYIGNSISFNYGKNLEEMAFKNVLIFRSFKRPMAVQDKKNEQHYINNYNVRKLKILSITNLIKL